MFCLCSAHEFGPIDPLADSSSPQRIIMPNLVDLQQTVYKRIVDKRTHAHKVISSDRALCSTDPITPEAHSWGQVVMSTP